MSASQACSGKIGLWAEEMAARYLTSKGYEILETRFRKRGGEIDIIAREGDILSFVEVKYRSSKFYGHPAELVTREKQRKICLAAKFYLLQAGLPEDTPSRFDVVALWKEEEQLKGHLYRNAFEVVI